MNVEITEQKENKLLARTEISGTIQFDSGVPAREKIREKIANKLKVDSKLVVVRKINVEYGQHESSIVVHVYEDKGTLKKLENLKKKHMKKDLEREKQEEEEAKKKAEEEAPAEEEKTEESAETKEEKTEEEKQ